MSGTILDGLGNVAVLVEVHHWGWPLSLSKPSLGPVSPFLLPRDLDVELSVTSLAPRLPTSHHAPHHEDTRLKALKLLAGPSL